jgi:hypothetical protein
VPTWLLWTISVLMVLIVVVVVILYLFAPSVFLLRSSAP